MLRLSGIGGVELQHKITDKVNPAAIDVPNPTKSLLL
jgi:hypothetical protein